MDELAYRVILEVSKTNKVVGLVWELTWDNSVSNSHHAPQGYKTNWAGKAKHTNGTPVPRGYPGWYGRVWIRYTEEPESFDAGRNLERFRVYPGTGGFGSYNGIWEKICHARFKARKSHPPCYSWDCKIFTYDFPNCTEIAEHEAAHAAALEEYEKQKAWGLLQNHYIAPFHFASLKHRFEWTEPTTAAEDAAFIAAQVEVA